MALIVQCSMDNEHTFVDVSAFSRRSWGTLWCIMHEVHPWQKQFQRGEEGDLSYWSEEVGKLPCDSERGCWGGRMCWMDQTLGFCCRSWMEGSDRAKDALVNYRASWERNPLLVICVVMLNYIKATLLDHILRKHGTDFHLGCTLNCDELITRLFNCDPEMLSKF